MSLYKTQRCRHFDDAGRPAKPSCTQGNKCRFIHPNDHQWARVVRGIEASPSPESCPPLSSRARNKLQLSPVSPLQRQRSSPLIPQADLFKRKQKDTPRDSSVRGGDRRREFESWGLGALDQRCSVKRANDEGHPYPNQRQRLSEKTLCGSGPSGTRHAAIARTAPHASQVTERHPKPTARVSDTFHRLAQLCCEIVQDTCFLDREEDKLKAFTGLSSELSRAASGAAMAVTPALATVITSHTQTRKRLECHVEELETLWKALFAMLEVDISKAIDSRLGHAMALLDKEKDNALRTMTRSQRLTGDRLYDGTHGSRQWTGGKETATDRTATLSERSAISVDVLPAIKTRHRGASPSMSLVPTQEGDLGTGLRIVLEDMRMQMDRQTRAIELLASENLQLKSATECIHLQPVPPDSSASSPRKPSIL